MIKSFEGGRGAAAILVALFHLQIGSNHFSLLRNGYLFVDLFFVLSGFVICAAYENKLGDGAGLRNFVWRRFGRLFPLLIFSTLLMVLAQNLGTIYRHANVFFGSMSASHYSAEQLTFLTPSIAELLATLTMTHALGLFDTNILNPVSWSISVEFYTYLLFGAICFLVRGPARLFIFFFICITAFMAVIWASTSGAHDCLNKGRCLDITYDYGYARCASSFFLGSLVFHVSRVTKLHETAAQITGITLLIVIFWAVKTTPFVAFLLPLVFALLVVSASADRGLLAALLGTRLFQGLGQHSYSIYMMHPVLLLVLHPFIERSHSVGASCGIVVLYLASLLFVSSLTFRYIEDPFRNLFARLANGKRGKNKLPFRQGIVEKLAE